MYKLHFDNFLINEHDDDDDLLYFTYNLQQLQVSSNNMIPIERETEKNDQCRYTIISDNGARGLLQCLLSVYLSVNRITQEVGGGMDDFFAWGKLIIRRAPQPRRKDIP